MRKRLVWTAALLLACGGEAPECDAGCEDAAPDDAQAQHEDDAALAPIGVSWDFEDATVGAPLSALSEGAVEGELEAIRGQREGAVAVAGGEGMITLADARAVDFGAGDSFRVELTFRTAHHGREGRGTLVQRGGERGFALSVEDGRLRFRVWTDGAASEVRSATIVSDDRWHQVSAIRDRARGELVLVVDGFDVARAPDESGDLRSAAPLTVLGADDRFWGGLDSLAIRPGRVDAPAPTPEWSDGRVFSGGVDGADGTTYTAFRIPAIVRLDSGTLLAFAEGRVDDECDFGRIHVVMKRSTDGGETWSALTRVATAGGGKAGNPIPIADGDRVALMVLETPCETGRGCECRGAQRVSVYTSDDEGMSWSARREITGDVTREGWGGLLLGPGSGIRLARGPHAGTLVVTAKHGRHGHLLASDDHGESWRIAAEESTSPLGVNETTAAELSDGRILVNARYQRSLDQAEMEQELGFRHVGHVSTDWIYSDEPTFSRAPIFRGPVVHGSLEYRVGSDRFGDEARLLFSFPAGQHGSPAGRRHDLRIYTSRDDGARWSRSRRMVGGFAAYSDLVTLADGRIGMLYEGGPRRAETFRAYGHLHFLRVRPEWLDHASLVTYSFEGLALDESPDRIEGAGFDVPLTARGALRTVAGEHQSTALRFEGGAYACTGGTDNVLDFGRRDSFAIEVTFRTTAHGEAGADRSGALVTKTGVGTTPSWWLRVEEGRLRFWISQCEGERINCGLVDGDCDRLTQCENAGVRGGPRVDDGEWHHARVLRDAPAGRLVLTLDGEVVAEGEAPASGIITNESPLCIGGFAEGAPARVFEGDIDDVRVELL